MHTHIHTHIQYTLSYTRTHTLSLSGVKLCSVLCEFMYFYFDFLFSSVSHFRFPNVYPLHLLSIMFSVFKLCPSLVKLPDCSSLLPSQSCCYLSVYHCLLRSRPSFAFGYSLSPSDFVPLLIGLFFWFDLPACHWTCCLPVDSVKPHCANLRLGHYLHVTLQSGQQMDPADSKQLSQALSAHRAIIGRHEQQLGNIQEALRTLTDQQHLIQTSLADQTMSLHALGQCLPSAPLVSHPPSVPQPAPVPAPGTPIHESPLAPPECYSGEARLCRGFGHHCSLPNEPG